MATRTGKPGSGPLTEKRHHYLRLVSQGTNNSEACRIDGVDRKAGVRWRHGRTVKRKHGLRRYEPIGEPAAISSRFLSQDERVAIADLRRPGGGVRSIAAVLGRSPSTISRELRQDSDPVTGSYVPYAAPPACGEPTAPPEGTQARWQRANPSAQTPRRPPAHRAFACRSRSFRTRSPGRRPHHGRGQPNRHRDLGLPPDPIHQAHPLAPRQDRRTPAPRFHCRSRRTATPTAQVDHVGSRIRDRLSPTNSRYHGHSRLPL